MSRVNGELQDPEFAGQAARAWSVRPGPPTTALAVWLVEATAAHPVWNYHVILVSHLRDEPGMRPPVITRPGATHELTVLALAPDHDFEVDPADISTFRWLTPPDVVEQFVASSDDIAIAIARATAQHCVDGRLVPDSDFRAAWRRFLQQVAD